MAGQTEKQRCELIVEEKGTYYCSYFGPPVFLGALEKRCFDSPNLCRFLQRFKDPKKKREESRCMRLNEDDKKKILYCRDMGDLVRLDAADLDYKCIDDYHLCAAFCSHQRTIGK